MDSILVLGGTGFLGRAVCEELVRQGGGAGGRLIVPTRQPLHGRQLLPLPSVEIAQADVHDDHTLARLVAGRDAVINLVGILHGSSADFERAHVALPRRIAQACMRAGVRRVVHVSALGAQAGGPSHYLRSKAAGEAALKGAELDLTVLRPSVMFGAEDHFLNLFARLSRRLPVLPLAGAHSRLQPVWVDDVARGMAACLVRPDTIGLTLECAGPRVTTLRELVEAVGRWSGHPRRVIPISDSLARLQIALLSLLPGEPLMTQDNLLSLGVPNIATGGLPTLYKLGIDPAPLEAVAPLILGNYLQARLVRWRAVARKG